MAKKTANNAIDFTRLFAVKEQLGRADSSHSDAVRAEALAHDSAAPSASQQVDANSRSHQAEVFVFPSSVKNELEDVSPAAMSATLDASPQPEPSTIAAPSPADAASLPLGPEATTLATAVVDAPASFAEQRGLLLRIGMPRSLHARLRASAALAGVSTTAYVRDLLDEVVPEFPHGSLESLARIAVAVVPAGPTGQRRIEMRMQVPAPEELHRRLVQFAALRSQTLQASLIDLLDAQVAPMPGN